MPQKIEISGEQPELFSCSDDASVCDRAFATQGDRNQHALTEHCAKGVHCTHLDASCAASYGIGDHFRCCTCSDPLPQR